MMQVFWRLPLLVLTLAAALPHLDRSPAAHQAAAAFVAAQDSARLGTQIPVLPLLGKGADAGGALRTLQGLAVEPSWDSPPRAVAAAADAPAVAASPCLQAGRSRAPPATR